MTDEEIDKLLEQIESELNGDPEHDAEVLNSYGEKYRDVEGAESLMYQLARRLFNLYLQEEPDMPDLVYEDMVETLDEDFAEACDLITQKKYDEAAAKLDMLCAVIAIYPLEDDVIYTDFTSYLEAMLYQDYYSDMIGDTEIRRHPLKPGPILYTYGSLLIEMGYPEEAVDPLEMLFLLDPVCPKYMFELGEAYKRTERYEEAFNNALWCLNCATTNAELARCYRDMAYCLSEADNQEDAMMLYMLSLHFQSSRHAEAEIAWIRKNYNIDPEPWTMDRIRERCKEVEIPVGISEGVKRNSELLDLLNTAQDDPGEEPDENQKDE